MMAMVLGNAKCHPERLVREMAEIVALHQERFRPHELSALLSYFVGCGFLPESFLLRVAYSLQVMSLKTDQVVIISEALACAMSQHSISHAIMMMLLPAFTAPLVNMRPEKFVRVVRAVTKSLCKENHLEDPQESHPSDSSEAAMPGRLLSFLAEAQQEAWLNLPAFTGDELAELAAAFSVVQVGLDANIFEAIANQAARQLAVIETPALIALLRSLVARKRACQTAVQSLRVDAMKRLDSMNTEELMAPTHISATYLEIHSGRGGFTSEHL
jgi:hypothetical protein